MSSHGGSKQQPAEVVRPAAVGSQMSAVCCHLLVADGRSAAHCGVTDFTLYTSKKAVQYILFLPPKLEAGTN